MKMIRLLVGVMVITCGSPAALAAGLSEQPALANFDKRPGTTNEVAKGASAATARQTALEQLRAAVPGVAVDTDRISGSPKSIASNSGFLTGAKGNEATTNTARAVVPVADPHRIVKSFLDDNRALFDYGAAVLGTTKVDSDYVDAHNGMRTVIWQQQLDGIDLFEGILKAHLTVKEELINIGSHLIADPVAAAAKGVGDRAALLANPPISAAQAVANAAQNVGERPAVAEVTPVDATPEGVDRRQKFSAPGLNEATARLLWLPMDASTLRLAWDILLVSKSRGEMFDVLIDAQTGEAVVRISRTAYATPATYRVFTSDSPAPFSPGWATYNTNQPSGVSRSLVTLTAISTNASRNGWINDGVSNTIGNNVDAHLDWNNDNVADPGSWPIGTNRVFDFPLNLAQSPTNNANAAVVQLFYWNNFMHDKLYDLGFTEPARNFQTTNFGLGGLQNDAVQADAQDGILVGRSDNANFSTPADGSPPRMQMYLFTSPTPNRDGDLDASMVLHEYGHGVSTRLVGGGVGISALQTIAMGEGWSDFYAFSLLSEVGDNVNGTYAFSSYVAYFAPNCSTNLLASYYFGLRRYPYSTDMTKNPRTFKDIDPAQMSTHPGVPANPIYTCFGTNFATEPHFMGENWCIALWEARANLITKLGYAGNQVMLQLVTDGLKLSPANPNFLQARDAILQADLANNAGANLQELWLGFAKRGMGNSATSSVATASTVLEAFDLPLSVATEFTNTWTTGGTGKWYGQVLTNHDGVDAAQSAAITHSQQTYMETVITGPGTLSFWWKVSSEQFYDWLRYYRDGVEVPEALAIAGETDWQQITVPIPAGLHTNRWIYYKDASFTYGADAGWVDQVVFTPKVANTNDSGPFSLRQVIKDLPAGSVVRFATNLVGQSIRLTGGQISLSKNVTIDASDILGGITINGNQTGRHFEISSGVYVTLTSLTLTNGNGVGTSSPGFGGSIFSFGNLTLDRCRLSGNVAGVNGGAVTAAFGSLNSTDTTISGNFCPNGAGIFGQDETITIHRCTFNGNVGGDSLRVFAAGANPVATIIHSTFSGNTATNTGTGAAVTSLTTAGRICSSTFYNCTIVSNQVTPVGQPGAISIPVVASATNSVVLKNSIVSGNTSGGAASDITGTAAAGSQNNFVGVGGGLVNGVNGNLVGSNNPQLSPLAFYGGATWTMPPQSGSPVIDAGTNSATYYAFVFNYYSNFYYGFTLDPNVASAVAESVATTYKFDQRYFPRFIATQVDVGATEAGTAPEIAVEQPVGTNLVDNASTNNFGAVNVGTSTVLQFTVRNLGNTNLNALVVTRDGANFGDFAIGALGSTNLAPDASTTFTVSFTPAGSGLRTAAIHIASNDGDENPFDLYLAGTGATSEIAVEQPVGVDLVDGSSTIAFGTLPAGSGSAIKTFTIRNTGTGQLTNLALVKIGAAPADFTISGLGVTGLAPGASATFDVTFAPTQGGLRSATLQIVSNDGDENPFDIQLTGTGDVLYSFPLTSDPGWSRQGEWAFGKPAGTGGTAHGFADPASGNTGTNVFGVNLSGDYSLTIGGPFYLTTSALNFAGYNNVTLIFQRWLNTDFQPYVSATIQVSSNGTDWVEIYNNGNSGDTTQNSWASQGYNLSAVADNCPTVYVRWGYQVSDQAFAYSGWNIDDVGFSAVPAPEILVEQPTGTNLVDGLASISFGSVSVGTTSAAKTFTISNSGTANLTNLALTVDGANAGDFTASTLITNSLPPGANTTFDVTFNPTRSGVRAATLHIASNSGGKNPFDISLVGTGATVYAFALTTDPGWTREGEWAFGQPAGTGGSFHGSPDPTSGSTGSNVFGVNLSGDYSLNLGGPYYLTVGPLDFTGKVGVTLRFQRWLNTDYQPYVSATLQVSVNGTNWTELYNNGSSIETVDNSWSLQSYSLAPYADNQSAVYVRWGYQIFSNAFEYSGWNIDDVEFTGTSGLFLQDANRLPNGFFRFGLATSPGQIFTVLAATNVSSPLSNWTVLGSPIEVSPGLYQFTDSQATNRAQRFYRVRSP